VGNDGFRLVLTKQRFGCCGEAGVAGRIQTLLLYGSVALPAYIAPRLCCVIAVLAVLSGCGWGNYSRIGPVAKMLPPQPDLCGAEALAGMVGKDFAGLAEHNLIGELRIIWPGQEITDDIVPTRLDAMVTNEQRITRLFCG
jgi:Peptidase inhibitor I78 family